MQPVRIPLHRDLFPTQETLLFRGGPFEVTGFRYPSGVAAVRLNNGPVEMVCLPFQGQQIWSVKVDGREIGQKTMFSQPNATQTYLETYGGFLLHCGASAMGVAGPEDNHPLHGHLPNAPYQQAWLEFGGWESTPWIALSGTYEYTMAFNFHYLTMPRVTLYEGRNVFDVDVEITNLKNTPMPFMYLAHANFRPVNGSRLVYSAICDAQHVRVRSSIPSHIHPPEGFREFLQELEKDPARHNEIRADLQFDPEVVFYIDYLTDASGWAHTLQVLPDGSADYIAHRPAELRKGVRWMCRTPDQDALGMVLPATAEPEGYSAELAKGNVLTLNAHQTYPIHMRMGVLNKAETKELAAHIGEMIEGEKGK